MSQIIEYIRSLFHPNINFNRKRRRTEFIREDIEPVPKYKRVTNIFPKEYTTAIDDETDYFREVKRRSPFYNELLGDFLMDQHHKQVKAILDDGEFSDEEDFNSIRVPVSRQRNIGFNFKRFYETDQQPSTSNAFTYRKEYSQLSNGGRANGDDDVQFVSISKRVPQSQSNRGIPSLVPITQVFQQSSDMTNGFSRESSVKPQPSRGRRSVLDFFGKNRAFPETPKPQNSIIDKKHNMNTKTEYDKLLQSLIPSYSNAAIKNILTKQRAQKEPQNVTTIDLSDDSENISKPVSQKTSPKEFSTYKPRKSELNFRQPTEYYDLSDDEADQSHFTREPCLSSTQIIKTRENDKNLSVIKAKENKFEIPVLPARNTLREKQSNRISLREGAIEKIVEAYNKKREETEKTIKEEAFNASQLERERIQHEKIQQKRIDESITSVLSEKCVIIDEEEDIIDEFPPLTDPQNKFVQYALHGPRNEVIVSKFNMNITRHDLATLDGLNWLNDEVINFYMELIKERSEKVEHLPKVHVMNTFFLGKLLQQGHSGVRRWTRKVDIFSFDIIPIPVHVGGVHWCMSVIHFKNKTIRYYDSMGHPNHVVLEALQQYLKDESLDKKKVPFDMSDWSIECIRDCPQQKNGSDCGVFSCQFAEFISRDSPISFEQQHMPYFRRKMICEIGTGKLFLGY